MDELTKNLVSGEQLLFSTEKVNVKPHLSKAQKLAGGKVVSSVDIRGARSIDINGVMAITDRRIFVIGLEGVFSKKPMLGFEAIFDPGYARTLIESTKAKNEEITKQAQGMGMFARGKFMKEQGYSSALRILAGVDPQKSLLGSDSLVLQIFTLYMSKLGQKGRDIGRKIGKVVSWGTFDLDKAHFVLRIKSPWRAMKLIAETAFAISTPTLYEVVSRYAGRTDLTYGR